MRKSGKRLLVLGVAALVAVAAPGLAWLSLTHRPDFYRATVTQPKAEREKEAKEFVAQSLQLRNDICNEPTWEALFTDQQVNAWLAEDLVTHFADQLPPEVHEPRVMFETDRVTLAFELDQGPVRSVIWVVASPHVPEGNVLELTIEKIRAGVLPVPPDQILDRLMKHANGRGLDMQWKRDGEFPVVTISYKPHSGRDDVKLERVQIRKGEMRLVGRSDVSRGQVRSLNLPTRQVLQSKFPQRKPHSAAPESGPKAECPRDGPSRGHPSRQPARIPPGRASAPTRDRPKSRLHSRDRSAGGLAGSGRAATARGRQARRLPRSGASPRARFRA